MEQKQMKTFGVLDMGLFSLCAIVVIDTLPATAAIGPSALGWWIVAMFCFFLPYGLVSAELGSAYPDEGGLGAWIGRAFGRRWGARVTWLYWAQLALGLPSVYVLFSAMTIRLFFPDLGLGPQVALAFAATWLTIGLALLPLAEAKWVATTGALAKIAVVVALIGAAALHLVEGSPANDLTWTNLLPTRDGGLAFVPIILFNLAGFELMAGASAEMKDPRRDVPRAIGSAGAVITLLYLAATASLLVLIPSDQLSLVNGIVDAFEAVFGTTGWGRRATILTGSLVLLSIVPTMMSWTLGVSRVAAAAARSGELPPLFGLLHPRWATPLGAPLLAGVVASTGLFLYGLAAGTSEDLFWSLTAFASILFLLPYVLLFAAFIRLRRTDKRARPYAVPGSETFAIGAALAAALFVALAILLFLWVPGEPVDWAFTLPLLAGLIASLAWGEYLIGSAEKRSLSGRSPLLLPARQGGMAKERGEPDSRDI